MPEVVTGKPLVLGGTEGRDVATGLGVVLLIEDVLRGRGETVEGRRIVVQGLGKVGGIVCRELAARGARIVGVSDVSAGVVARAASTERLLLPGWVRTGTCAASPAGGP